jgi:Ca2+/Na+ antiporter
VRFLKDLVFGILGYMLGTRRRRHFADVFRRKIVITIHPWAIPFICLAIALPIVFSFTIISNMVMVALIATALILVWRMNRYVQQLRYDMHRILHDIGNEDLDEEVKEATERISVKTINGQRSARVSKR